MSANRKRISNIFIDEKYSPKILNFPNVTAKSWKIIDKPILNKEMLKKVSHSNLNIKSGGQYDLLFE